MGGGRTKLRGGIDIVTVQTLARHGDIAGLTAGYGLVVADECHHVPAAAFEDAIRQVRVPAQQGPRRDSQLELTEPGTGERPGQGCSLRQDQ